LAARELGVDWPVIAAALKETRGVPGRLDAGSFPDRAVALVDYAHTAAALAKVIRTLRELPHRKLIVVFGCGGDRDRAKRPRMARAAGRAGPVGVCSAHPPGGRCRTEN
jgi:UDP-N-acetylmuramoyl-L-alanyl-D-glutamate--2,6-diaminopimelate ligase